MKNIFVIIALCILVSCATTKKISETPVVVTQEHTEYVTKEAKDTTSIKDSIYIVDSIFVKEKGDTIYYYKTNTQYKYKTQYRYVNKTDTLLMQDSIPYPVTVMEYQTITTNELTWLQKALMTIGVLAIILVLGIIIKYVKLYLKNE